MKTGIILLCAALALASCRTSEQRAIAIAVSGLGLACGLTFGLACAPAFFLYDEATAKPPLPRQPRQWASVADVI